MIDETATAVPNGITLRLHRIDVDPGQRCRVPCYAPFSVVERDVNFLKQRSW